MLRTRWLFFYVPAQPHEEVIDRARSRVITHTPGLSEQRFARYGLALVLNQVPQQIRVHERKGNRPVTSANFESVDIDRLAGERIHVALWLCLCPLMPPQQTADAREQDRQFERFRQIIVRAGFEPAQYILR